MWLNAAITGLISRMLGGSGLIANQLLVSMWSELPFIVAYFLMGALFLIGYISIAFTGISALLLIYSVIMGIGAFIAFFAYIIAPIAASQDVSKLLAFAILLLQIIFMSLLSFGLSLLAALLITPSY